MHSQKEWRTNVGRRLDLLLPFSTSAHVSCLPFLQLPFLLGSFCRKERFEATAAAVALVGRSVGYTENEALPKENSSGRGSSQLPKGKKDVKEEDGPKPPTDLGPVT